jgi:hypothetical protein
LYVYDGVSYKIRAGDLLSVAGVPTSRQVIAGTALTGGGALSSNVTISVANGGIGTSQLASSGVTPGVYGNSTNVPVFTVDATGRVMSATTAPITISGYVPTSRQIIAGTGLSGGGNLSSDVTLTANFSSSIPLSGASSGSAGTGITMSRADHQHPSVDLADSTEVNGILGISNGGTAKSLVMQPGAVIWSGADGLYVGPAGAAGQVLVSGGTSAPTWAASSGTVTSVAVSGGTTGLTTSGGPITGSGTITLAGTLIAANGGTGFSTYAVGDILYASTTTALSKLADVATGNSLISGGVGVAPSWGKIGLTTHVSGTLAAGNGGTGIATYAIGDILYASTTTALSKLADVATGNALISGGVGVAPSWGKIGLTTHVSGTLPIANGGTNGTATPTAGGIAYGTGTAYAFTAVGISGQVLTSSGAGAPTWTSAGAGTVSSVDVSGGTTGLTVSGGPVTSSGVLTLAGTLAIANGGTGQTTASAALNALLPAQATNSGKFLTTNGTDASWATVSGSGTVTSVAQTFTGGLISVAGSPITSAGTLALTVAGTSGGVPYFSSASTWASSAALAIDCLVIGGGAGAAPITTGLISCNPSTGQLFASQFQGSGEFLSNVYAIDSQTTQNAYISSNNIAGFTVYPTWTSGATTGDFPFSTSSNKLSFVPDTGVLSTKILAAAGTASAGTAPLKLTAGTNLTTAEAGAIEYNGSNFFATETAAAGRSAIATQRIYRQIANGTTTTAATIADFFPANSSIALAANTLYEIEVWAYFLKTTAGTVTFSMASSVNAYMAGQYIASPATGLFTTGSAPTGNAAVLNSTTVAWAASASLTTGVNHGWRFRILVLLTSSGNWRLRYTSNAGTTQSLINSYYTVLALPSASAGAFVA